MGDVGVVGRRRRMGADADDHSREGIDEGRNAMEPALIQKWREAPRHSPLSLSHRSRPPVPPTTEQRDTNRERSLEPGG